jgi:hypothetical protein
MCSASFVISLGSLIDGMSSKHRPLFDAPQATRFYWDALRPDAYSQPRKGARSPYGEAPQTSPLAGLTA